MTGNFYQNLASFVILNSFFIYFEIHDFLLQFKNVTYLIKKVW